jgi:tetratricopeptide (TPR) repeat protein
MTEDRQIRVFISSTFRDMQEERDILIKTIFPQLRKLCDERAVNFIEIDLRWGITSEQAAEGKVLPLCLDEIQRCRPFFIGLLGERYGSLPGEIPADLLQIRPWLADQRDKSITELEMIDAVLLEKDLHGRAFFYFRDPGFVERQRPEKRENFIADDSKNSEKLARLKNEIRQARDAGACQLREGKRRKGYSTPKVLGRLVLRDFTRLINELYPKRGTPSILDQEAARHTAYARNRRLAFVGRSDLLAKLDDYALIQPPSPLPSESAKTVSNGKTVPEQSRDRLKPLVLTGDPGCGKSALIAEWAALWRQKHLRKGDVIIDHYIGSTPDSADWQALVRRILGELKCAFNIADELPLKPEALRNALEVWTAKLAGPSRRVVLALDSLNQLSDDGGSQQLDWLPTIFPANFRVVLSALEGESLEVLRKRGCQIESLPLFKPEEIGPAISAFFEPLGRKQLPQETLNKLKSSKIALNPLYLRAVLDELRQFGDNAKLKSKAEEYVSAGDLPELFSRILTRWDEDFGKDPEYPDLVRRTLCLMTCSRFGLSEAEILQLLGSKSKSGPLPRRPWTPFFLAAESSLNRNGGLLDIGHDCLRAAVRKRWLGDGEAERAWHLDLAEYFATISGPAPRKMDELPWQYCRADLGRLKAFIADLPNFVFMRAGERLRWDLQTYWEVLSKVYDPGDLYEKSISRYESDPANSQIEVAIALTSLGHFFGNWGAPEVVEKMHRQALAIREKRLGPDHPETLSSVTFLAICIENAKRYSEAESFHRRAYEGRMRVLGAAHPDTLTSLNNLAVVTGLKGDFVRAEALQVQVFDEATRVLGPENEVTLRTSVNLAFLLQRSGDLNRAETFYRKAASVFQQKYGKGSSEVDNHRDALATFLANSGKTVEAETIWRDILISRENTFGKNNPIVIHTLNGLAMALAKQRQFQQCRQICEESWKRCLIGFNSHRSSTIGSAIELGDVLFNLNEFEFATKVYRFAQECCAQVLGPSHEQTLVLAINIAYALVKSGQLEAAEQIYAEALSRSESSLGPNDPTTLDLRQGLRAAHQLSPLLAVKRFFRSIFKKPKSA